MRSILLSAFVVASACVCSSATCSAQEVKADAPPKYASPKEVFDAYRAAFAKQDSTAMLRCYTPQGVDKELSMTITILSFPGRTEKEVAAVIEKYGVSSQARGKEFERRLNAMYAQKPLKLIPEDELKVAADCSLIKDRLGFYAAAMKALRGTRPLPVVSELSDLVVTGDTAEGRSELVTDFGNVRGSEPQVAKFKKLGDSWMLESFRGP